MGIDTCLGLLYADCKELCNILWACRQESQKDFVRKFPLILGFKRQKKKKFILKKKIKTTNPLLTLNIRIKFMENTGGCRIKKEAVICLMKKNALMIFHPKKTLCPIIMTQLSGLKNHSIV